MHCTIRPCRSRDLPAFCALLTRYFREELHLPISAAQADELAEGIWGEAGLGVPLLLAFQKRQAVAFINYQIDFAASSWCFHPGWGCIRELYVAPEQRHQGIAQALVNRAAADLQAGGAPMLYLTADTAIPFWERLGFVRSGRINEKNELEELEKALPDKGRSR